MKRILLILLALAVLTTPGAANQTPNQFAIECLTGTWIMKQNRGSPWVLMTVRQEDNIYPSIWAGKLDGGTFVVRAREDFLTQEVLVDSTGSFALRISSCPDRRGLEHLFPAQQFVSDLGNVPLTIEFGSFSKWKPATVKNPDGLGVWWQADYQATLQANGRKGPIAGSMLFQFERKTGVFTFATETTFTGADFGLTGRQAGKLNLKIRSVSPPAQTPSSKDLGKGLDLE